MKILRYFAFLSTILLFIACNQHQSEKNSPIRIGAVLPLSGAQATFGISAQKGMDLAITEINQNGGLLGQHLQVITLDDHSSPEEAALAITKLISQEKVVSIIGEIASSRSLSMAPIAQQYRIPMISPGSTNPRLTELGNFIFRICFIDPFQGEVMAKFARYHLKLKKVAVLTDTKSDYSVGLSEFFASTFQKEGGNILMKQSYNTGDIDFKSQLTAIRSQNPEAIFIPGSYIEVGLIARQVRELGMTLPLLGGDDWDSPKLLEIAGSSLEHSFFSNHYAEDDQSESVQKFIQKFQKTYSVAPDGLSVLGYDAIRVFADAVTRSHSKNPQEIQSALTKTNNFPGITGSISLDQLRNARTPAVVLQIKEGRFKYETTIMPK